MARHSNTTRGGFRFSFLLIYLMFDLIVRLSSCIISDICSSITYQYLIVTVAIFLQILFIVFRTIVKLQFDDDFIQFDLYYSSYKYSINNVSSASFYWSPLLFGLCLITIKTENSSRYFVLDCPFYARNKIEILKTFVRHLSLTEGFSSKLNLKWGFKQT